MQEKKHIYLIDYLKAAGIIMVIITHYEWEDKTTPFFTWLIAMAVPIFMLLMSYNFSMSYERKTHGKITELYQWKTVMPRIVRFTVPFTMIFVLEMILEAAAGQPYSIKEIITCFAEGGVGPGSYYYPILIQLLFLFPVIYLLVKHISWGGVGAVALVNLAYEYYVHYSEMELDTYRLLAPRYLLFLAMGCYLYFHLKEEKKYPLPIWSLIPGFLVGFGFIVWVYQLENQPELTLFRFWTRTSMLTAFYIFPIIYLLFRYLKNRQIPGIAGVVLSEIGKASYHIFLVQMLYYEFFDDILFPLHPAVPVTVGNVLVCLTVGYGFYRGEKRSERWRQRMVEVIEMFCREKFAGTFLAIRIYYRRIRSFVHS